MLKLKVPYNERALLQSVAIGDVRAFAELFHRYHPFLSEHLLRLIKSSIIMEEILQDTFLKIWIGRKSLIDVENFTAYLLVVSRNEALKALDKLNKELRSKKKFVESRYFELNTEDETSLIQTALIDKAIDSLSKRQKQIFLLHKYERLTYVQIANRLNISRETVKTHLEKAGKTIKGYIRDRIGFDINF